MVTKEASQTSHWYVGPHNNSQKHYYRRNTFDKAIVYVSTTAPSVPHSKMANKFSFGKAAPIAAKTHSSHAYSYQSSRPPNPSLYSQKPVIPFKENNHPNYPMTIIPLTNLTKYVGENARFKCQLNPESRTTPPDKKLRFKWFKNEAPLLYNHDDGLDYESRKKESSKDFYYSDALARSRRSGRSVKDDKDLDPDHGHHKRYAGDEGYEDSANYISDKDKYSIKNAGKYSILRLRNLEIYDRGFYRCEVDDGAKRTQSTGWLYVNPDENPLNLNIVIPKYPELNFDGNFPIKDEDNPPHQGNNDEDNEINNSEILEDKILNEQNEKVHKALSFDLTHHMSGRCEPYAGRICASVFAKYDSRKNPGVGALGDGVEGTNPVFIKGVLTQLELENHLKGILELIENNFNDKMSPECAKFKLPLMCFKTFPPCITDSVAIPSQTYNRIHAKSPADDNRLPRPRLLCKDECLALQNGVCQTEFGLAKSYKGIKNHLQTCDILPEVATPPHPVEKIDNIDTKILPNSPTETEDCLRLGVIERDDDRSPVKPIAANYIIGAGAKTFPPENAAEIVLPYVTANNMEIPPSKFVNNGDRPLNVVGDSNLTKNLMIILPSVGLVLALFIFILLGCWYQNRRLRAGSKNSPQIRGSNISINHYKDDKSNNNYEKSSSFPYYNASEIIPLKYSANGFSKPDNVVDNFYHETRSNISNNQSSNPSTDNNLMEIPFERLNILQEIGEGVFGKIYKGEFKTKEDFRVCGGNGCTTPVMNKLPVIVKSLKPINNVYLKREFEKDIDTLSKLKHPNVSCLIGICKQNTSNNVHQNIMFSVFEDSINCDLHEFLLLRSPNSDVGSSCHSDSTHHRDMMLDQTDFLYISTKIAEGMRYLSDQGIIHRDLSARNCVVSQNLSIIKICNVGGFISHVFYSNDYCFFTNYDQDLIDTTMDLNPDIGGGNNDSDPCKLSDWEKASSGRCRNKYPIPIRWMPPEVIEYRKYSLETDLWSFGILLWEIYSYGLRPFYGYRDVEVADLIVRKRYLLNKPSDCPGYIYESIMLPCWDDSPFRRPPFKTILTRFQSLQIRGKLLSINSKSARMGQANSANDKNSLNNLSNESGSGRHRGSVKISGNDKSGKQRSATEAVRKGENSRSSESYQEERVDVLASSFLNDHRYHAPQASHMVSSKVSPPSVNIIQNIRPSNGMPFNNVAQYPRCSPSHEIAKGGAEFTRHPSQQAEFFKHGGYLVDDLPPPPRNALLNYFKYPPSQSTTDDNNNYLEHTSFNSQLKNNAIFANDKTHQNTASSQGNGEPNINLGVYESINDIGVFGR
ncbi:unnamed protein product [Gordionus sp. m RMFG-2023]|uniref:tyrosine-protein kinase receptor cam-1-like isoform X2 n=1 Tax=Gordionus sp. m RMFG-2023 TaxID=3053472 RepID=UPI0030E2EF88